MIKIYKFRLLSHFPIKEDEFSSWDIKFVNYKYEPITGIGFIYDNFYQWYINGECQDRTILMMEYDMSKTSDFEKYLKKIVFE